MHRPPIVAYHVIWGAYGFWLPNDPRGSWSTKVWANHLKPFGPATKTDLRTSLAGRPHDRAKRLEAKRHLKYPAVKLEPRQVDSVAAGFSEIADRLRLSIHACTIMPDHVHLVAGRGGMHAEEMAGHLKRAASRRLSRDGRHPFERFRKSEGRMPSPWAIGGWYVYLHTGEEVIQRIRYVEGNPIHAGLPPQRWPFVVPYESPPRGRGG